MRYYGILLHIDHFDQIVFIESLVEIFPGPQFRSISVLRYLGPSDPSFSPLTRPDCCEFAPVAGHNMTHISPTVYTFWSILSVMVSIYHQYILSFSKGSDLPAPWLSYITHLEVRQIPMSPVCISHPNPLHFLICIVAGVGADNLGPSNAS